MVKLTPPVILAAGINNCLKHMQGLGAGSVGQVLVLQAQGSEEFSSQARHTKAGHGGESL